MTRAKPKPVRTPVLSLRATEPMAIDILREAKKRKTSTSRELKRRLEGYAANAEAIEAKTTTTAK
jgi:hypothetical protein